MSQLVVLRLFKNNELVEVKQFDLAQIVIGKSAEAQLSIDDDSISALHAVIENRDGKFFVSDLGSDTGIFIDDKKVLEKEIDTGSEIQLGDFVVHFFIGVPKAMAAPTQSTKDDQPDKSEKTPVQEEPDAKLEEKDEPQKDDSKTEQAKSEEKEKVAEAAATAAVVGQQFSPEQQAARGTYAPESAFKDVKQIVKPQKGTVVEVIVSWQERIISTSHFSKSGNVYIGTDPSCDVQIPILGTQLTKHKFLKVDSMAHVIITNDMAGEYVTSANSVKSFRDMARNNQMQVSGSNFIIDVAQGDMVLVKFLGGTLVITVRYIAESPKPALAPFFDLSTSETAGVILAVVIASLFSLYMMVYSPEPLEDLENKNEEPVRKAMVTFKPPKPKKIVKVGTETKEKKKKTIVKVKDLKKKSPSAKKPGKPGKAASVKKSSAKKTKPKKLVSQRKKGAGVKTGGKGASAKSKKPDPLKSGLFTAFGKNGMADTINKTYSGSGELTGMAEQATGKTGFSDDRSGKTLGGRTKATPGSGRGKRSVGVGGPITAGGKGAGNFGFGSGSVGKKGSVNINVGGAEEAFVGTIDKEAIRRVILDNISEIRNCYERVLNTRPDLFGKLVIEWDIEEQGKVKRAKAIKNSTGSRKLASCVVRRLKNWRFPEPPDDQIARVTYPFVFAAK